MATTVAQHSVATFTSPVNGTTPIDANTVRGNDNTIRAAYNNHDADPGIHVQSSTLASRPVAGTAGRKWITADTGSYKLWYDDGTTWHEVANTGVDVYVIAGENLVKGDIVKVTGYNNGQSAPIVAKVASATDVAFGIVTGAIANGSTGYVTNTGIIADVDTGSFAIGDILYPNTSGGLTTTKPTSGNYQVVAYVLRANTNNGVLYVEFSAPRIVEASTNTASTIVRRDASGNFAAGAISVANISLSGVLTIGSDTAMSRGAADRLDLAAGDSFNVSSGTYQIGGASVLSSTTLGSGVVNSSLTSVGTLTSGSIGAGFTAIPDTALATISTAGKVSNSATTATSANTANAIVARDASGNFSAGTITATLNGAAPAGSLSGNTLASGVTASSLTSVGTLTSLAVSGVSTFSAGTAGAPALTTSGDTNTGLYFPAADTIGFTEGGVEAMRIDSGGNLCVGTATSVGKLTVNTGSAFAVAAQMGNSAANRLIIVNDDNAGYVKLDATGASNSAIALRFDTGGAEKARLTSGGDLLINTTSASGKLTVNTGSGFAVAAQIGNSAANKLVILNDDGGGYLKLDVSGAAGAAIDMRFDTGGTERARIPSVGGFVVGTAALATTATDGFLYVPTCAGTPTGTPTTRTGTAPIVINTTNNKLYFYSGGAWRDAGP